MNESLYPFVNHTTYDIKALSALVISNKLIFKNPFLCILKKEKGRKQRYTTVSAFCL